MGAMEPGGPWFLKTLFSTRCVRVFFCTEVDQ